MITNHFQLYLGESCPRACSESRSHDSSHCLKTIVLQGLKNIQKSYKSHVQYSWQLRHSAGDKAAEKQRLQDLRRFFDHHCKGSSAANRLQSRDASHNGASRSYFTSEDLRCQVPLNPNEEPMMSYTNVSSSLLRQTK